MAPARCRSRVRVSKRKRTYDGLYGDDPVVEIGSSGVGPPEGRTEPGDGTGGGSASGYERTTRQVGSRASQAARAKRKKGAQGGVSAVLL